MQWIAIDTLNHPTNGTFFSIITARRRTQLILWYQSGSGLRQGDTLHVGRQEIYINTGQDAIVLLNSVPFNRVVWQNIRTLNGCYPS